MGTLMQLLLEALRANVEERRNELRPLVNDVLTDEMSGFILENVHVATMPYIETDEDEEPPNPLLRLVRNRRRPNRERLWLAPAEVGSEGASYNDSDYYPEEEEEEEHTEHEEAEGHEDQRKASPTKESHKPKSLSNESPKKMDRVTTRPVRLEKEERGCFARLLFSRCWTGKDQSAGWKIKRRCPTGHKASLSCPCGQIGPCKKVKPHAVPIDQMKSTNKKGTKGTSSNLGSKSSHNKCDSKHQNIHKNVNSHPKSGPDGKPFYEKLFPCCFKDHKHTECCCRCKDNPPLSSHRKPEEEKKTSAHKVARKPSVQSHTSEKKPKKGHEAEHSESPSEEEEVDSEYYDDQSGYATYPVRSEPDMSLKTPEKINRLSRKQATGDMRATRRTEQTRNIRGPKKQSQLYSSKLERKNPLTSKQSSKSTTSFQIMLHPDISKDRVVESEVVSHQILKTLSTIHGPVKVEQKIVVQGTTNSVVIVTHGEACQCNLCSMLKGKMHPRELIEGLSPQVVRISTDHGSNTLINHSDGCKCDLCLVLDPVIASNGENRKSQLENESLVMTASTSNEKASGEGELPAADQTLHVNVNPSLPEESQATAEAHRKDTVKTTTLPTKKSKCKALPGLKKAKKCRCTKCRQRRRIEKLKSRLMKEIGSEEYERIIQELTRSHPDDASDKHSNQRKSSNQSDSDDNDYIKPKRNKRQVSFSDEPFKIYREESEDNEVGRNERKRTCKLCELASTNINQANGTLLMKGSTSKSRLGPNYSTMYSINTSSRDTPCECHIYRGPVPKGSSHDQLRTKSNSTNKGVYQSRSEEQKCFPPGHLPKRSRENQAGKRAKGNGEEDEDNGRCSRHGSNCSGKCRRDQGVDQPGFLLQEGGFPQKFVYWSPRSVSNVATAYSSDSYYVPDMDEFPIVNMEYDESATSSGKMPVHRVQIPVWFRMLPDQKPR